MTPYHADYNRVEHFPPASPVTVLRPTLLDVDSLTGLLAGAADAHHVYEQSLGHADANWQHWYAAWIMARLAVPASSFGTWKPLPVSAFNPDLETADDTATYNSGARY